MYELAVNKHFIAQHFLIGGDWGAECVKHSHNYKLEIHLRGKNLDNNGYLVDITTVEEKLDRLISRYSAHLLNDLPEFKGINPSIENLARIAYESLRRSLVEADTDGFFIKVWEDDKAWVSYREG